MAESLLAYALTTVARVKDRLTISVSTHDTKLQRLINAATDFIEAQCDRRFKETTYTNEVYSVGAGDKCVLLRNYPVSSISSLQYRAGLNSSPSWTSYSTDDYYLLEDGRTGIVEYAGSLASGPNMLRATYVAGYKINFANAGDNSTHTLPHDLSDLCERLVTRWWKRREEEGKSTESFDGGTVSFLADLTQEDKDTIEKYRRFTLF